MKKIIFVFCFITIVYIVKSQENKADSTYQWQVELSLDLPDLEPEAILFAFVDFNPTEKFIKDFNHSYLDRKLKEAKDDNEKEQQIIISVKVGWIFLFKSVTGNNVFLLTNKGTTISHISDIPFASKQWLISKPFKLNGKPFCFAVPLNTDNNAVLECKLDENNMISLLDIYKSNIELKK